MVIVAMSVVASVAVLNFHYRSDEANAKMPFWIRTIFLQWLPWFMRMKMPGNEEITPKVIMMENKVLKMNMGQDFY
jgi:hypothetical protein